MKTRHEHHALLCGEGQFTDDLTKPSQLTMKVLRSPSQIKYIGEPIAAVFAETEAIAQDALECIDIGFETLAAETQVEAAAVEQYSR